MRRAAHAVIGLMRTTLLALLFLAFSRAALAQQPTVHADLNGDGFSDLVVGVPGFANGAGGVHVLYGSSSGLTTAGNAFFSQDTPGVPGTAEADDNCGSSLATGDFNGDGFSDVAVGCPGEDVNGDLNAGAVFVLYGSTNGISASTKGSLVFGSQLWDQDSAGVLGDTEPNDRCGSSLATGDFNHDGRADLAWGCPGEASGGATTSSGAVMVLYGSATGLTSNGNQFWSQGSAGVGGSPEDNDRCGAALATGDFNGDGRSDLAWGCPGEDLTVFFIESFDAGAVNVLYGTSTGLTGSGSVFVDQRGLVFDGVETGDKCGAAIAAGDFDNDGRDDLAMGCSGEDIYSFFSPSNILVRDLGGVQVLFATSGGFATGFLVHTDLSFLQPERCGSSLATGDEDGDGFADFAIGCPGASDGAGSVAVIRGSVLGNTLDPELFSQRDGGGNNEVQDGFGTAVTFGDFDGDGFDDLAVGAPGEDFGSVNDAGTFHVIFGTSVGLTADGSQLFTEDTPGIVETAQAFEKLGFALAGSGGAAGPGLTGSWSTVTEASHGGRCTLEGTFTAINPSTESTPHVVLRFYLSVDPILDPEDLLLDDAPVRPLKIGESQERTLRAEVPCGDDISGRFVIGFVDADDIVDESNEQNNIVASDPIQ